MMHEKTLTAASLYDWKEIPFHNFEKMKSLILRDWKKNKAPLRKVIHQQTFFFSPVPLKNLVSGSSTNRQTC